jgi:pilus assembly protein Flp/PilA
MVEHTPRQERGASSVEYGLLLAGIAALIAAAIFIFGGQVADMFDGSCDTINQEISSAPC